MDALGDAYEYLRRVLYPPADLRHPLRYVTLDSQEPKTGTKKGLERLMDTACGSGSLLLNMRKKVT